MPLRRITAFLEAWLKIRTPTDSAFQAWSGAIPTDNRRYVNCWGIQCRRSSC